MKTIDKYNQMLINDLKKKLTKDVKVELVQFPNSRFETIRITYKDFSRSYTPNFKIKANIMCVSILQAFIYDYTGLVLKHKKDINN